MNLFAESMIKCENDEQFNDVCGVLNSKGFKKVNMSGHEEGLYVRLYFQVKTYQCFTHTFNHLRVVSYEKFMGLYKMLSKIKQAKEALKLNDSELSVKLGYSRQYIGKAIRNMPSQKVQDKIIQDIDKLLNPEDEALNKTNHDIDEVSKENEALKKELSYKNQVLDKRNAELENSRIEVSEKCATIKFLENELATRDTATNREKTKVSILETKISGMHNLYIIAIVLLTAFGLYGLLK